MPIDKPSSSAYSPARVRRSLLHFFLGKSFGMLTGFALLLVLVRALDIVDYGFYIASQALLEISGQLSSMGLLVATQRYLPELLSRNEGRKLFKLTFYLLAGRILTLLLVIMFIFLLSDWAMKELELVDMTVPLKLFLLVILFENIARFFDIVFDSLLLQGVSQISLLLRSILRLIPMALLLSHNGSGVLLTTWIQIDALAALVSVIWGGYKLWQFLSGIVSEHPGKYPNLEIKRYLTYSLPSFISVSLYTASGPNAVRLVAAWILSAFQYASFGFSATFASMLQRYLPIFLLIGMIRPLFIVARQNDNFTHRLPALAGLVFKLNTFALLPIAVFIWIVGEPLADILSGGRFPDAGGYIFAFIFVLIAQALRAVVSLTAQALENARAPLVGTFFGILGLMIGIITSTVFGAYGFCFGMILSELFFSGWVLHSLRGDNIRLRVDWSGYTKLFFASAFSATLLSLMSQLIELNSIVVLAYCAILVTISYLLFTFVFKPFTKEESSTINHLLKKKVFIW